MTRRKRTMTTVAVCVLGLHVAALWALQAGLSIRKPAIVIPVQLQARLVEPPRPIATAPSPVVAEQPTLPKPTQPTVKPRKPRSIPVPVAKAPSPPKPLPVVPAPTPAPIPMAAEATATPVVPAAPVVLATGNPAASRQVAEPTPAPVAKVAAAPASPPPRPHPPAVELPSSDAQYLQNPRPRYPPISRRLREQGTVLVHVLVSEQGLAKEAKVQASSGYFRLDNVAVSTVLTWRFVPGKRGGVAQSMWFTVPIEFAIQ
jgi:protein TonB